MIDASGNKVDTFWPSLFSKALAGIDIKSLMSGSSAPAPAGSSAATETKKEEKIAKEEPKKEEAKEAEEDMDMGDLFAF